MAEEQLNEENKQEFSIQRLYIKDLSFESPNSPQLFRDTSEWQPEVSVELNSSTATLSPAVHEVVLGVTITAKMKGTVAFLVEVKYGGVFTLKGFADEQLKQLLGSYCPSVLFPFVREIVSDTVVRGGFPQLILAPINFDAVYAEQQKQSQK